MFDLNVIFAIEFLTFLVAVSATWSVQIPKPPKAEESKGSMTQEVLVALKYIRQRNGLFALLCFSTLGKITFFLYSCC